MSILIAEQRRYADRTAVRIPCHEGDAELWFAQSPEGVARAQQLCAGCPRRAECLAGAVSRHEPWGVWGGELFENGVPVARKRRPGRPRKDDGHERELAEQALAQRLADVSRDDDELDRFDAECRGDEGAAA